MRKALACGSVTLMSLAASVSHLLPSSGSLLFPAPAMSFAQPGAQPDRLPALPAGALCATRSGGRLPRTLGLMNACAFSHTHFCPQFPLSAKASMCRSCRLLLYFLLSWLSECCLMVRSAIQRFLKVRLLSSVCRKDEATQRSYVLFGYRTAQRRCLCQRVHST